MKIISTILNNRYVGIQQSGISILGQENFLFWQPENKPINDMLVEVKPDVIFTDIKYVNSDMIEASKSDDFKIVLFGNGKPSDLKVSTICTSPNVSSVVKKYLESDEYKTLYIKDCADVCTIFNGKKEDLLECDFGYVSHDPDIDKIKDKTKFLIHLSTIGSLRAVGSIKIPFPLFLGGIKFNRISSFIKSCKMVVDFNTDILLNAAANNAFVISNTPNALYPSLNSEEDIKRFLTNDSLRNKITKKAQSLVLSNDTCYHRFSDIMGSLEEYGICELCDNKIREINRCVAE